MMYLSITALIVVVDQFSKYVVKENIALGEIIRLFDGEFLWLWHVANPGMAFGIHFFPPLVLAAINIAAVVALILYLFFTPSLIPSQILPLSMILGGALGNLIDRLLLGEVVDFISVDFPNFIMHRWPIFNVADSAVTVGVSLLVVFTLFHNRPVKEKDENRKPCGEPAN